MSNNESIYIDNNQQDFAELFMEHEKATVDKKREVIVAIKTLASTATNWKQANEEFNKLLNEFKEIPYYDQKEIEQLNEELRLAKNEFFEKRKAFFEKAQEGYKENEIKKQAVIEKLKNVVYANNLKEIDELVKSISDEFYAIGSAGKDINNNLYHEFKKVRSQLHENRKSIVQNLQSEFASKAERKKEIIEKLNTLVNNENWKKATEEFNSLCDEFKSIGFSGKEGNEEISTAYAEAKNTFFAKRQEYFDKIKAENKVNIEARIQLIEELKALYSNDSWKEASEKVKELSEKFFNIGFCGKEENERLINEFKSIRDGFYKARQEYFDGINSARANKQKDFLNGLISKKEEFIQKLRGFVKNDEERLANFTDRLFNGRPSSMDKIENMQNIVEDIKSRIESNKSKIKEVQGEIFELKKQLSELK